jgi:hypothetical protein
VLKKEQIMCKRCDKFYKEFPLTEPDEFGVSGHSGTSYGSPVKCAFVDGRFTSNNWSCMTMSILRSMAYENGHVARDDMNSGSIAVFNIPENDAVCGYLVMSYYKDRGCTGMAVIMNDDSEPTRITERQADLIIDAIEKGK